MLMSANLLYLPQNKYSANSKEASVDIDKVVGASKFDSDSIYGIWYSHRVTTLETLGAVKKVFSLKKRMRMGAGQSGLATSVRLHGTYGAPIIPGKALKGLMREYTAAEQRDALYGSSALAGSFDVLDALWVPGSADSSLVKDIITPHHKAYHSPKPGVAPAWPTAFDEPEPVPVLAVQGSFLFAVVSPDTAFAEIVMAHLHGALENMGIGARTGSGYGYFKKPDLAA